MSIGLQGETPTASPTAGASAIPAGAVGAQAPGRADPATGIPGVSSSQLLQALQALGLAKGTASLIGEIGAAGGAGGAGLGVEVPPTAQGAALPGGQVEIGHEIIPGAESLPGGGGAAEAIEQTGAGAAPTGAEVGTEGTQAATAGSSAAGITTGIAGLAEIVLPELFGRGGQQAASIIGLGGLAAAPFFPPAALLGIPDLVSLFSEHGLPGFGPSPAMPFPQSNLVQLEQTVRSKLPAPLEAPPRVSPDVKAWIDAANKERDDILANFSAANLSKTGLGWDRQSAESWRNIWGYTTADVQDRFAHLQGLYETALQGLAGLPVPTDIPSYGGVWGRSLGTEKTLAAFPQLKTPPAKPPEKAMLPPQTFFRGREKLPDEDQK